MIKQIKQHIFFNIQFTIQLCLWIGCSSFIQNGLAQDQLNEIFDTNIGTVLVLPSDRQPQSPLWNFTGGEPLVFRWDDLSEYPREFIVSIRHLNIDGTPSDLDEFDFMQGMNRSYLFDFKQSFNANTAYRNYQFKIPNQDFQITQSGKYQLEVRDASSEELLFRSFFIAFEPAAEISGNFRNCTTNNLEEGQEVSWKVDLGDNFKGYQAENCMIEVIQNMNFHNTRAINRFSNKQIGSWMYSGLQVPCLPAGREYLFVDMAGLRQEEQRIREIVETDLGTQVYLSPDFNLNGKPYIFYIDMDGNQVIRNPFQNDWHTTSDYVTLHFAVEDEKNDALYIQFPFLSDSLLMRRVDNTPYKTQSIRLKQGYINYEYTRKNGRKWNGNYYQTQNLYHAILYHKAINAFTYSVIGYGNFNTGP